MWRSASLSLAEKEEIKCKFPMQWNVYKDIWIILLIWTAQKGRKTTLFHNARPAILQALKDISAQNQYELDFKTAGTLEPRIISNPQTTHEVNKKIQPDKPIISIKDDKREIKVYIDKVGQLCLGDFIETKIEKQWLKMNYRNKY